MAETAVGAAAVSEKAKRTSSVRWAFEQGENRAGWCCHHPVRELVVWCKPACTSPNSPPSQSPWTIS